MRATEYAIFFGFLLAPPLLLGFAVLALLRQRFASGSGLLKLCSATLVLSTAIALGFVIVGPSWLARTLGVRESHLLGLPVSWAPFAFVAVGAAVLVILAFLARARK